MDLVMQLGTQPLAHRLCQYFEKRQQYDVFPAVFADSAEEVGPFTDTSGPCLVWFRNVQITPQSFNCWLQGSFVRRSTTRVFWLQQAILGASSREELAQAIHAAGVPEGTTGVRVDIFPKKLELEIGDQIYDAGFPVPMHPVDFSHFLFVVQLGDKWHWSYLPKDQLWRHPPDKPAIFNKSVATAINKISEGMQVLGLQHQETAAAITNNLQQQQQQQHALQHPNGTCDIHQQQEPQQQQSKGSANGEAQLEAQQYHHQQQRRWAIDIGACPGGWTTYLSDCCWCNVIAIDPAELHPDVTARPWVYQIKGKAQDVGAQIDELLQGQQVDLLVCDMNDHPTRVGELLLPVIDRLKPGGWLILTLKFYGKGRDKPTIGHKMDELFKGYLEPGRVFWLMANTVCERTFAARRLQHT